MGTVTRMELRKISEPHPYEHNAKLHPPEQIEKLRAEVEYWRKENLQIGH